MKKLITIFHVLKLSLLLLLFFIPQPLVVKTIDGVIKKKMVRQKTTFVKKGDTIYNILHQSDIPYQTIQNLLKTSKGSQLTKINPGSSIILQWEDGKLRELQYYSTPLIYLSFLSKDNNKFACKELKLTPVIKPAKKNIFIKDSLFISGRKAGLSDKLILNLVKIFDSDIDFALDLQQNDFFSIVYEEHYLRDKKIGVGSILAARFKSKGRVLDAIRYIKQNGQAGYYSPNGQNLQKSFIRTPVDFAYISSGFTSKRLHPVLGIVRPHRGVDYAAPINTPVKVTGDGIISFLGYQKGYGKVILVSHKQKITTVYAHLNGYNSSVKRGQHVKQGCVIGYVGMTGYATGPHLHYEFRVNGVHKNPLTVKLPNAPMLSKKEIQSFLGYSQPLLAKLERMSTETVAMNKTVGSTVYKKT